MPSPGQPTRVNLAELKLYVIKKFGWEKAEKYFYYLERFLSFKLNKSEYVKLCLSTIGRENKDLHNFLIRTIFRNARLAHLPPNRRTNTGQHRNFKISNGHLGDTMVMSPHKGCNFKDRLSPQGPYGKVHTGSTQETSNICDSQKPQEYISFGSRALLEVGSVEDGEEVEQVRDSPGVQSRSPVRPPLGISMRSCGVSRKHFHTGCISGISSPHIQDTCYCCSVLPDSRMLKERLERRLELEGLSLSIECVNLLNSGLDMYLKRLIKPCIELAGARCNDEWTNQVSGKYVPSFNPTCQQRLNPSCHVTMQDFRVAMGLNPQFLGEDWPAKLEKICLN